MFKAENRVISVVQARMGSNRLPGKTMMKVGNKTLISHVLDRLLVNFGQQDVILATTVNQEDDVLIDYVTGEYPKMGFFRGDQENVRSRFEIIAQETNASHIIRITADDPFKDPRDIALCKQLLLASNLDYFCNFIFNTIPLGMDVEGFSCLALKKAAKIDDSKEAREHVTTTFRNTQEFNGIYVREQRGGSLLRLTIDNESDLEFCGAIASRLQSNKYNWEHTIKVANEVQQSKERNL